MAGGRTVWRDSDALDTCPGAAAVETGSPAVAAAWAAFIEGTFIICMLQSAPLTLVSLPPNALLRSAQTSSTRSLAEHHGLNSLTRQVTHADKYAS